MAYPYSFPRTGTFGGHRPLKGTTALLFSITTIGYFIEFMPGVLLHLITIVLAGVLDRDPTGFSSHQQGD